MDFHQLKVFLETAREKNFSRAAENIFLTQPTVSAHIKSLENEVGVPLFDRSRRELELTEAGQILFRYARELLDKKEEALSVILKESKVVKGHLEVAASSVPGAYLLPELMVAFKGIYPQVTFSVLLRDTKQVLASLREHTYSIGLVGEAIKDEGMELIKLVDDELILVTPAGTNLCPNHTQSQDELPAIGIDSCRDLPFILREPGSATRFAFEKALKKNCGPGAKVLVAAYLESQEAVKEAVKAGLGVSVISKKAVAGELKHRTLEGYRLADLELERSFYLIYRRKRVLPPLQQAFLDYTIDYFASMREGRGAL